MVRIGDICVINPKAQTFDEDYLVSFVPMPKVGENGEFDASDIKEYREVKKGFTYFQNGDVLFAKITPCMENGKGAIARNLKNGIGFGSTEFHVLRPIPDVVLGEWLYYLLSWTDFRKEAEKNMTGSAGQKRVPKSFLENYHVVVPSLDIQEKQVNIFKNLDLLISLRKQQLSKLDELVKSRFIEMFGDVINNDRNWPMATMGDVAEIKIGPFGTLLHKEDYIVGGHALVNPSHIVDGKIAVDIGLTISDEKYEELSAYHLKIDDIVLGRRGEMGRCAVVREDGLLCGTGSLIIRPNDRLKPYFLQTIISNPTYKKIIEDKAVGVTMMNINVPIVESLRVPMLPIELQNDFISFMEQIDKSKFEIQTSLEKLETLKKALMQKYFG